MAVQSVGVVGAGQMGNGIAHVFALAGYDVLMNDISAEAMEKAVALIDRNLERQVSRDKISAEDKATALARIRTTTELSELGQCDLVIEAATENDSLLFRRRQAEDLRRAAAAPEAGNDPDVEHVVDFHHPAGEPHRPAREVHGLPFHEPRPGDAAGGTDPRHRHG